MPAISNYWGLFLVSENLRIAFFPDSYLEVNGAAMTCRRLTDYARRNNFPFLCIHAGPETKTVTDGSTTHCSLKRSPLRFALDEDLAYDPLFQRHQGKVRRLLEDFKPDVIHITGLNDVSIIGVYLAWRMQIPMIGSWHTNIHEFAASRIERSLKFLPKAPVAKIASFAERKIKAGSMLYYKMPKVNLSPNSELVSELARRTGRASRLMGRGVDAEYFSPLKRTVNDGIFRLGFVGRLRAEKNVRLLVDVEKAFIDAGITNFEFLVVGEGSERAFLEENMKNAVFTGFLDGEKLAEAYANMDLFIFPSETDAFGNVAQEANASGVPAIVSSKGGPKYVIREGISGLVAREDDDYAKFALDLYRNKEKLAAMKADSRNIAESSSWDSIFRGVYDAYREALDIHAKTKAATK